jgi:hypothetical protein
MMLLLSLFEFLFGCRHNDNSSLSGLKPVFSGCRHVHASTITGCRRPPRWTQGFVKNLSRGLTFAFFDFVLLFVLVVAQMKRRRGKQIDHELV